MAISPPASLTTSFPPASSIAFLMLSVSVVLHADMLSVCAKPTVFPSRDTASPASVFSPAFSVSAAPFASLPASVCAAFVSVPLALPPPQAIRDAAIIADKATLSIFFIIFLLFSCAKIFSNKELFFYSICEIPLALLLFIWQNSIKTLPISSSI